MSAATDGFSAMMSFLPMPRKAADDKCKQAPASTTGAPRQKGLARHARARRAEKILRHEAARGRVLVPHHHQHDELELLERERLAGGGERALDHQLARLRSQDSRVLERQQEAAALRVELGDLALREGAERAPRVGQIAERRMRAG